MLIYSLLKDGQSRLTELAHSILPQLDHASRVKKLKRWIKNEYIDCQHFFIPFLAKILESLAGRKEVVLAIDGSPIGSGCVCLMISLIWRKRAIPLCWLVRRGKKGHFPADMHVQLVNELSQLLPPKANITLLGDGEFSNVDLVKLCESKGWNYVFRVAKNCKIQLPNREETAQVQECLYPAEGEKTAWYPEVYYTNKMYGPIVLLCHHDPTHEEPWYLISNIDYPNRIIKLYKKRFGIETLFSDLKSRGFNIHKSKLRAPDRLKRLLIAVCLAFIFTLLARIQATCLPDNFMKKICRQDQPTHFSPFYEGKQLIRFIFDFPDYISNNIKELLLDLKSVRF